MQKDRGSQTENTEDAKVTANVITPSESVILARFIKGQFCSHISTGVFKKEGGDLI